MKRDSELQLFIGCNSEIHLKCKKKYRNFSKDKVYIAKSTTPYEGSSMFTKYIITDDKDETVLFTVELLVENIFSVMENALD